MTECVDKVIGDILAGWRYDISGLAPEMRSDYEAHLQECEHCRSRQRLHRTIDVSLIVLAAASAVMFLLAFGVIWHFKARHALILELIAIGGFLLSTVAWLLVAVSTPAPLVMVDAARIGAQRLHDKLPPNLRERIPEELRLKISGQS